MHRWTRREYYRMAEAGLFDGRRVELIEGQVIEMSPMGSLHSTGVTKTTRVLFPLFYLTHTVRVQMPLTLRDAEPEPDVAVVAGSPDDYRHAHPATAVLIVEVAETSLAYDRTTKARLYARAGVAEYWILNLSERRLEVRREPRRGRGAGYSYAPAQTLNESEFVSPLALPQARLAVADLLP